jgi:hypothetical protein
MNPRTLCEHVPTGRLVITTEVVDMETGEIVIVPSEIATPAMRRTWLVQNEPETVPLSELRPVNFDRTGAVTVARPAV